MRRRVNRVLLKKGWQRYDLSIVFPFIKKRRWRSVSFVKVSQKYNSILLYLSFARMPEGPHLIQLFW